MKINRKMAPIAVTLISIGSLSGGANAQTLTIDAFSAGGSSFALRARSTGDIASRSDPSSNAVGTSRDVTMKSKAGYVSLSLISPPFYVSSYDYHLGLAISTHAGAEAEWSITYTGFGSGLNLSNFDNLVTKWQPDHVGVGNTSDVNDPTSLYFTLTDSIGNSHTSTVTFNTPEIDPGLLFTKFSLSDFSTNGVDLTDIETIVWGGDSDFAGDYGFESIVAETVPEPSTQHFLDLVV